LVPLIYGTDTGNILYEKMDKLNGVFLPGGSGGAEVDYGGETYWAFSKRIWKYAKKLNDEGTFYPLWGTCLGFQNMI
jgi:gamma-glutamyl hydrolase